MTTISVAVSCLALILGLWLVLRALTKVRPEVFRFKATFTKWGNVEVEMRKPTPIAPEPPPTGPRALPPERSPAKLRRVV